ncbi:amidohydrolase family protein [Bacteroidota bacterium]
MIIDSHHHLWRFNSGDYGWMDPSMDILKQDYLPGDLRDQLAGSGVTGTVVVQARQIPAETRWLLEQANKNDFIKGVVGWVDLQRENLDEQLKEFAGNPKLVGVRHVIHDEPDDDFMLRPAFVKGIEKLGRYNLTFDLLLFPRHLQRAVELVSMFPEQKFVLDHISKPIIKTGILDPWRYDIQNLAAKANVWCKISGMVTEADKKNWRYEDFVPYLDVVTEVFGTDRIMLGSDWPVCLLAGQYKEIMDIPVRYFGDLDPAGKDRVFRMNCIEFYKLSIK